MSVKYINDEITGDMAQTFYVESAAVKNASQVFLHSVDLYFYTKPYDPKIGQAQAVNVYGTQSKLTSTKSTSQLSAPGVTVYIVPTKIENQIHVPDLTKRVRFGRARVEFDNIAVSTDASQATRFQFKYPVAVSTQTTYAFVVKFDGNDSAFSLFRNKTGEAFTSESSFISTTGVARGAYDGYFFLLTNGLLTTQSAEIDLKFKLNINKFSTIPQTISAVNRNFEIVLYNSADLTGNFVGGEFVFANTGFPVAQTVSINSKSNTITGSGTTFLSDFTVNDLIVINSGNTNIIRKITAISSDSSLSTDFLLPVTNTVAKYLKAPVAKVWDYSPSSNTLTLIASTANSSFNFSPNSTCNTVIGVVSGAKVKIRELSKYPLDVFTPVFNIDTPPGTSANVFVKLANTSVETIDTAFNLSLYDKHMFTRFPAALHSRTIELANGAVTLLNGKSVNLLIDITSDNEFTTPTAEEEGLTFIAHRRLISNTNTNEHIYNGGLARSKYISRQVIMDQKAVAEDMIVYLNAYRPQGSEIEVYCKFYNNQDPESFASKNWSKLEMVSPRVLYSSVDNKSDIVTLEYRVPNFPVADSTVLNSGTRLTGTFACDDSNNTFYSNSSSIVNSEVANNDIVRIFDPLSPNNSLIAVVTSANSTAFTIDKTITTANTSLTPFVSSGLNVENVTYKNMAFKNATRSKMLRYYNFQNAAFDGYNSYQFKIVMLADSSNLSPIIHDIRGIACSV